jgi:S-adenosylmethionine:tRNA ribosyltransferase-isomerase
VRLEELDFDIAEGQIAQEPVEPRDSCRLMVLQADGGHCHSVFSDLPGLLRRGDMLVFNDSRVLPARVHARKPSGGAVELLFLQRVACAPEDGESWEALARPTQRLRTGGELVAPDGTRLKLAAALGEGRWLVTGPAGSSFVELMERCGLMPLPPYIKTYPAEPSSYQTVYAAVPGSAAAPTAGLHFTPALLERLAEAGIGSAYVTLHVGLDTFQPIREETVEEHRIHRETYSVSREALESILETRRAGGRLIAVGTTATRVLETLAQAGLFDTDGSEVPVMGISGSTEVFITPGYRFRAVDVLLTNFHLPRSTVLALAMAFTGRDRLLEAYAEAIQLGYRFFTFGDAMLVEPLSAPATGDPGDDDADV